MAIGSGHSSTLSFGSNSSFSPGYTSIGVISADRPSLDTTTLTTTGTRTYLPGDVFSIAGATASFLLDPVLVDADESNCFTDLLFDTGNAEDSETITVELGDSSATAPAIAGNGHVTSMAIDDMLTDTLLSASIGWQWNDWPTTFTGAQSP